LYDLVDYDKLEDEEALEVLRLCVKPTSLSNFFEKLEKNTRFVLQYTPKVDKINMEVFGDFYKDYIAYQMKFEFVLAFMSKEIQEEYIPSFTKGGKQSLKRLFLSQILFRIGERIIDYVPVSKSDAIANICELIHRIQRE
jgi:hypothetical protein